jgi:hypothetical protein
MIGANVPLAEARTPYRLVARLLRPDGTVAMERTLAAP